MSKIDEAEDAIRRCRKVSTGDIIMPDDINCLADGASSSVGAVRYILNEIYLKMFEIDLLDYYRRLYGDYNVDRTGSLVLLEIPRPWDRYPRGVILFDGADADSVVVELPRLDPDTCSTGLDFATMALIGRDRIKYINIYTNPTTTVKFEDPDLVALFFLYPYFSTEVKFGEVRKIPEAINIKFMKGSSVTKSYTADVIGQLCGDEQYSECYRRYSDFPNIDIVPLAPERWHIAEFIEADSGPTNICAIALDSTDDALAEVLAYECTRGSTLHMRVHPGTKKIKMTLVDMPWMLAGFYMYYVYVAYFGKPDLSPNVQHDRLYCGGYVPLT